MIANPKQFHGKLNNILAAWSEFAPETKFGGMTQAEFKTAVARSLDSRQQLELLRMQIRGLLTERAVGDMESRVLAVRMVAGVIADPDHGPNSPLYRALNYVPTIERASGLTNKKAQAAAPAATATSNSSAPSTK